MMQTAPFRRRMDKIAYVSGSTIIVLFSYLIGKFPHSLIFTYYSVVMTLLLAWRYYDYYWNGCHMFLFDFCYLANFSFLLYINLFSTHSDMFITLYIWANGPLAAGVGAFRNSLVYHKFDMLVSTFIHVGPLCLTTHIRWFSMLDQVGLPAEEKRFADPHEIDSVGGFLLNFYAKPLLLYALWIAAYGYVNFVVCGKEIKSCQVQSCYQIFHGIPLLHKINKKYGVSFPVLFLLLHFSYYIVLHTFAILLYHSIVLNITMCVFWLLLSAFNGANYYMEYFARKYEK